MKRIKRIVAVFLFIITLALVGYLLFTGSRLTNGSDAEVLTAAEAIL